MFSLQLLPAALLTLMFVSPTLSAATSKNDPFRAIALQVPPKPDLPICCLRPLPTLQPVEDDVLLSFEEWKVKQSAQARTKDQETFNRSTHASLSEVVGNDGNASEPFTAVVSETTAPGSPLDVDDTIKFLPSVAVSPHFRVPLTDRFNYADLDCSARVHLSHRSAKSSSSILSSKRDRYMLSPCNPPNKEQQFVVVELCEDIRIDTVQLANFEFFSGVFKDFRVSVAKTYTTDGEGWTTAGTYRAQNIRGVQSFHPPTSLRHFYRYLRIDFLSHYGNEFYCPVSLLRVYGLTHLEEWKWETWEAESKAKLDSSARADMQNLATPANVVADSTADHTPLSEVVIEGNSIHTTSTNETTVMSDNIGSTTSTSTTNLSNTNSVPVAVIPTSSKMSSASRLSVSIVETTEGRASTSETIVIHQDTPDLSTSVPEASVPTDVSSASSMHIHTWTVTDNPSISYLSDIVQASVSSLPDAVVSNGGISRPGSRSTTSHTSSSVSNSGAIAFTTTIGAPIGAPVFASIPIAPPPAAITTGGESIYRTIMNRLTALEANHTLYARYVEQQTGAVREMLRRLGEDVGRLEGIGRAQAQTYQRTVHEWEKRQHRLQMEYGELMSRVEYLTDEIVLEKRLGAAQLCLLLAVLVFMGLTRGSRGESFIEHAPGQFNRSMREWGKRHLSFSGDWTNRFRSKGRSGSVTPNSNMQRPRSSKPLLQMLDTDEPPKKELLIAHHITTALNDQSLHTRQTATPSYSPSQRTRHHQHHTRPAAPTTAIRARPGLQRSSSQGGTHYSSRHGSPSHVAAPRSARRWARTAHLHEVKLDAQTRSPTHKREDVDIFSTPTMISQAHRGRWKRDLFVVVGDRKGIQPSAPKEGDGDPWEDTDLDVGESEEDELKVDPVRPSLVSDK